MNRPLLLLALSCTTLLPARALAETTQCTPITSLPATISSAGVYCLRQDLSTAATSGAAITINANNVTLDCNRWRIGGLAAGATTLGRGILAIDRVNIAIRNCTIRGFYIGIELRGSGVHPPGYHVIADNRLDLNTYRGMFIQGDGSAVRGNAVFDTGGGTRSPHPVGIETNDNVEVIDNVIGGVTAGDIGIAYGIMSSDNHGGEISRNRIWGLLATGGLSKRGIWSLNSLQVIRDNTVINQSSANPPDSGDRGIECHESAAVARDNVVTGFGTPATPILNCTSVGNTVN